MDWGISMLNFTPTSYEEEVIKTSRRIYRNNTRDGGQRGKNFELTREKLSKQARTRLGLSYSDARAAYLLNVKGL